ncbi:MAG: DivIVA domain-containing protein [Lachnospiraceae bacterium]|nr:DivIVA domain-containing protein [Lachnospiraceae bacterium]
MQGLSEIRNTEFKKVAIGYSVEEVDQFIKELIVDYEAMYTENIELKDKVGMLTEGLSYYRSHEKSIKDALAFAENTTKESREAASKYAEEIRASAQRESEQLMSESRLKATMLLHDAGKKLVDIEQKVLKLESQYELMRTRIKLLLYAELELIDKGEIISEKEKSLARPEANKD